MTIKWNKELKSTALFNKWNDIDNFSSENFVSSDMDVKSIVLFGKIRNFNADKS